MLHVSANWNKKPTCSCSFSSQSRSYELQFNIHRKVQVDTSIIHKARQLEMEMHVVDTALAELMSTACAMCRARLARLYGILGQRSIVCSNLATIQSSNGV